MNRLVTVDLEEFVIQSMQSTEASFDSDITNYMLASISLYDIRSGETYYDYNVSAWYKASNGAYLTHSLGDTDMLTIKNGDN